MESDLINRQMAINTIMEQPPEPHYPIWYAEQIIALPTAQPEIHFDEWCVDCKEYDHDKHCCPRFNKVIRRTVEELKAQPERKKGKWIELQCNCCGQVDMSKPNFCPNCGADMRGEKDG